MTARQFQSWLKRHELSWTQAAKALGMGRRMIGYYASGEKPIPRTVALSCWAIDHGALEELPAKGVGSTPPKR